MRQMESNGGATSTRQNPNGNGRRRGQPRHGLECPEDTFVEKICGHEAKDLKLELMAQPMVFETNRLVSNGIRRECFC